MGIKAYLDNCLGLSQAKLNFDLYVNEFDASKAALVFEDHNLIVSSLPLQHRLPTMGYLFTERSRKESWTSKIAHLPAYCGWNENAKERYAGPPSSWTIHHTDEVCLPKQNSEVMPFCLTRSFCIHSTAHRRADVLYHETTYLNNMEKKQNCANTPQQVRQLKLPEEQVSVIDNGSLFIQIQNLDDFSVWM